MIGNLLQRGFHGKTRPKRRLLYCPSLGRASKVLKVPVERDLDSLGICLSPIRFSQCSQNIIYENHETCDGNSSEFSDSSENLPTRLRANCKASQRYCSGSARKLRFCDQPEEVSVVSIQQIDILGMAVDSNAMCLALPSEPGEKHPKGVRGSDCKSPQNRTPICLRDV